eukprot:m.131590 g.131590  ORF g.131590 m.131590 type:complete len:146 (-) comp17476_c0_seq22:756-1193(-)
METPVSVFNRDNTFFKLGIALMVSCQAIHLVIMVASTIKLAKQLLHHTATSSFLLQAYFSTIILYAGIYTLLHRYQPDSWRGTDSEGVLGGKNDSYVVRSFVIFVYYSIATMTSTGYGDVHPESWYRVSAGGWNAPEDCAACARM